MNVLKTLLCAIYARVSTNKQDNGNQLIQLREFAAKQGWTIVAEYVDTVSGSGKKDRAQFDAMMLAASQKKFDVLLFWKLDRLSREGVRKTLRYLEQLDSYGVAWRSFTEQFFDSCGIMRASAITGRSTSRRKLGPREAAPNCSKLCRVIFRYRTGLPREQTWWRSCKMVGKGSSHIRRE